MSRFIVELESRFYDVEMNELMWQTSLSIIKRTLCKASDSYHLAAAICTLSATHFFTFDQRQGKIAESYGLQLLTPPEHQASC